jgi:predicted transposase/invertase (TIGR01784 family)
MLWAATEDGKKIGLEQGFELAHEEARKEAREEARIAMLTTAKKLLTMNMSPEQVSQATGLPIAEIDNLLETN